MGVVIEDKEFDPSLRERIAAFVAARYVESGVGGFESRASRRERADLHAPDYGDFGSREPHRDRADSYVPDYGGFDPFTGEPREYMPPMPDSGRPDGGYRAAPMAYGSAPPAAAAPPMAESKSAPRSKRKKKAGILESASELYERVREGVGSSKRESAIPEKAVEEEFSVAVEEAREAAVESAYGYAAEEVCEAVPEEAFAGAAEEKFADAADAASPGDTVKFKPITPKGGLQDWLDQVDEPFSTTLLMLIDRKGLTDVDVYKRANMSRQLFSRIRSDALYRPAKKTVLALGIALELTLDELRDLLERAGFALSRSSERDLIVEYFVTHGDYNLFHINEALYEFDQPLI